MMRSHKVSTLSCGRQWVTYAPPERRAVRADATLVLLDGSEETSRQIGSASSPGKDVAMTPDEPSEDIREAVTIALDEDDVGLWLAQWQTAPGPLRQRMETDISLAAVVRNHDDSGRRNDLRVFHAIVDDQPADHEADTGETRKPDRPDVT